MPPKVKYPRDHILSVALDMTRKEGIESVTARELGARLGASSRPVFTAFENMEEVHKAVEEAAKTIFRQYIENFTQYKPAFKRFGIQMVRFAIEEPKLYQLLFMKEKSSGNIREAVRELYDDPEQVVNILKHDYGLDDEIAWKLFSSLTIFSYGIGLLCARRVCTFTYEEIETMLGEQFAGLISLYKSGQYEKCNVHPTVDGSAFEGKDVSDLPFIYYEDIISREG